jgi:PKD repeat protein
VNFIAQSEHADFFEWNMGDGSPITTGNKKIIQHIYQKTGVYDVTLTVSSAKWWESNQIHRRVFVTDTNTPFALINVNNGSNTAYYDPAACGSGATVINRSEATNFDGSKSINIDGGTSDLTYTWSYFGKVKTTQSLSEKMNEIGCYPIKLTVRSNKNGATQTATEYIAIKNQLPELTSISTSVDTNKKDSQKVLVRVNANGASDQDGVITSYIWYYTTESDHEPQSVQITQKPEITFVLPNITEKYYFGVILEDNDGAKTNSMNDTSEQVPLILDNQNGNIYMPLISLSMPKNAVLVGEGIHMSAEAKTIIGTNITKNAEYAWDFDGDGKFDERSANPSVNHVFKNSGTYSMKVRVTYNGVSNTKYGTIYVKNPLKANASIYELTDGSIYILNTSEWTYDRSIWTIAGEQTESPYTLTISKIALDALSGSMNLGTLRVSNGETDTSSYSLSLSDKIAVASWSGGIAYQSSVKPIDNSIHIKGQSDKLVLSLIGNSATMYKIDSDIRIDSDLDGVPDNDSDNKDHVSYNDGSAYVISDFADARIRDRTIRVTLMDGWVVRGTQDIHLILDFVPDTTTGSGEDILMGASGAMSSFERSKLEELASMIRTTDGADRIVLMQEYNTMIENWSDSFSKAKSLIDIQEVIDTTSLTADKKDVMGALIDTLLVGDATSTDEITLASKLIQDLIPQASPNRATILEKLTAISSHPSDITENRKLGNEILDLIKTDTTIEDKYKLHIRNQLRIIINGGEASTPSVEVEEVSATGGGILSFISGVVWIFVYIIWGIFFVLLLGYIFYLISRKNTNIGFQDFLIDSVFHAKKADTNNTGIGTPDATNILVNQTPASVVIPPVIKTDPLANYTPPAIEIKPITIETSTIDPLTSAEPAPIPSWLQVPNPETPIIAPVEELPSVVPVQAEIPSIEIPENLMKPVIETSESAIPSWLQVIDNPAVETSLTTEDIPPENIIISDREIAPESIEKKPESPSDALPDWLVDSLKTPETTSIAETIISTSVEVKKPEKKKKAKKAVTDTPIPPSAPIASADIPDWLK